MPQIEFTETELLYVNKAVSSLMRIRRDLAPKDWDKPQNKLVRSLDKKFSNKPDVTSFVLDRVQIRALLQLTTAADKALSESTIPAYEARIQALPDKADFYKPYLSKSRELLTTLRGLTAKLEGLL